MLWPSGVRRRVFWYVVTNSSEELAARLPSSLQNVSEEPARLNISAVTSKTLTL